MDSITQIALGAAVGEACLGKKIGNRALIWGGIAGTIPDLDVLSSFFLSDFDATMFHRGPTHSLLFSFVWPWILGLLVFRLYDSGLYLKSAYRWFIFILGSLTAAGFFFGLYLFAGGITGQTNIGFLAFLILLTVGLLRWLWKAYLTNEEEMVPISYVQWVWFFFLTTVTHTLLDCCTSYGTQLYWPFASTRVSWDIIAVADPFFTVPFVLFLIAVAGVSRHRPLRTWLNYAGLAFITLYFGWTIRNWNVVQDRFEDYMVSRNIPVDRMRTTPSILNNILWYGVVQSGDSYYRGWYSLLDDGKQVDTMFTVSNGHGLVSEYADQKEMEQLRWFSDDFFHVVEHQNDTLFHYDLRFGFSTDSVNYVPQSVFGYKLLPQGGDIQICGEASPREGDMDFGPVFRTFIRRIRGI